MQQVQSQNQQHQQQQHREVGVGLSNLGNTCYISAVLQAFAHAPELYLAMECENHLDTCPFRPLSYGATKAYSSPTHANVSCTAAKTTMTSTTPSSWSVTTSPIGEAATYCVLCELEHHLLRVHSTSFVSMGALSNTNTVSNSNILSDTTTSNNHLLLESIPMAPTNFVKGFMTHVAPWFRIGSQEDSHEFLRLLIDAMQSSCIKARKWISTKETIENRDHEEYENNNDDNKMANGEEQQQQQKDSRKEEEERHISSQVEKQKSTNINHTNSTQHENTLPYYPFQLFRGSIESTVTCSSCHTVSRTLDPMEDLGLEVTFAANMKSSSVLPPTSSSSSQKHLQQLQLQQRQLGDVTSSLRKFIDTEKLDSGYKCETCGVVGHATKQSKLVSIPPIVTLHLKRFRYRTTTQNSPVNQSNSTKSSSRNTSTVQNHSASTQDHPHKSQDPKIPHHNKNHNACPNPTLHHSSSSTNYVGSTSIGTNIGSSGSSKIEGFIKYEHVLDLRPYLVNPHLQKSTICRLFAIIVHIGKTSHSGHYIAYVRNMSKNEWYRMDDAKVTRVSKEEIDSAEAYMLFYRVVDHPIVHEWKKRCEERCSKQLLLHQQEESHTKASFMNMKEGLNTLCTIDTNPRGVIQKEPVSCNVRENVTNVEKKHHVYDNDSYIVRMEEGKSEETVKIHVGPISVHDLQRKDMKDMNRQLQNSTVKAATSNFQRFDIGDVLKETKNTSDDKTSSKLLGKRKMPLSGVGFPSHDICIARFPPKYTSIPEWARENTFASEFFIYHLSKSCQVLANLCNNSDSQCFREIMKFYLKENVHMDTLGINISSNGVGKSINGDSNENSIDSTETVMNKLHIDYCLLLEDYKNSLYDLFAELKVLEESQSSVNEKISYSNGKKNLLSCEWKSFFPNTGKTVVDDEQTSLVSIPTYPNGTNQNDNTRNYIPGYDIIMDEDDWIPTCCDHNELLL